MPWGKKTTKALLAKGSAATLAEKLAMYLLYCPLTVRLHSRS